MLEPEDDILIPRQAPQRATRRLRQRHAVRILALLLVFVSLGYAYVCHQLAKTSLLPSRVEDYIGIAPVIIFALLLWWYAGRERSNLHHYLFRRATDAAPSVSWLRTLGVLASMAVAFLGLLAFTYGATIRSQGERLREVVWSGGSAVIPIPKDSARWGVIFMEVGGVMTILAAAGLFLSRSRPGPPG